MMDKGSARCTNYRCPHLPWPPATALFTPVLPDMALISRDFICSCPQPCWVRVPGGLGYSLEGYSLQATVGSPMDGGEGRAPGTV